ncbi:hypothetical protein [Priestia megaterium]|uniref:hypothetical protein n=1 Tax=Priestia megaterium TaxID=1404 RepID=UPI002E2027A6|nr:hypothetical protein [Priestia megaterium]
MTDNVFTNEEVEKLKEQIYKTGFVLENKICRLLEDNNWSIINNRYYLDDLEGKDREIDIIAYKVHITEEVLYYTTLVISCKKSEKNSWTFLTKDINQNDPNIHFCPVNNWSNHKILKFMLEDGDQNIEYRILELSKHAPPLDFIYGMDKQVFAFQQLNKTNFSPQNDRDIYNSIITTIKALEYEKNSLDKRIKHKALYNFNLLSIFDGDMIQLHFDSEGERPQKIDEIKYLNRHIVNKEESFYRVHFMKYEKLNSYIENLNELHRFHTEFYPSLMEEFYSNVPYYSSNKGWKLLIDEFEEEILWRLNYYYDPSENLLDRLILDYDEDEELLYIDIEGKDMTYSEEIDALSKLNDMSRVLEITSSALEEVYRYEGNFIFARPSPF